MKLHLGCGTIYLEGYVNIDADPYYLTNNAPSDILKSNTTTLDNYYKHKFCKGSGICVADVKGLIDNLPFKNGSVEEIVLFHVLEHFPVNKVKAFLYELRRVLLFGGKFYVAVPDVIGTSKLLVNSKTEEEEEWGLRLLHGTRRNEFSFHHCMYSERTLKNLLSECGFGNFTVLPNINFYPAIHILSTKGE